MVASRRRSAIEGDPLAAAYATVDNDCSSLFCILRKVPSYPAQVGDDYKPFSVTLPLTKEGKITLFKLSGKSTDNNFDTERVMVESLKIPLESFQGRFAITKAAEGEVHGPFHLQKPSYLSSKEPTSPRAKISIPRISFRGRHNPLNYPELNSCFSSF